MKEFLAQRKAEKTVAGAGNGKPGGPRRRRG
jgi:hypothetical protein